MYRLTVSDMARTAKSVTYDIEDTGTLLQLIALALEKGWATITIINLKEVNNG